MRHKVFGIIYFVWFLIGIYIIFFQWLPTWRTVTPETIVAAPTLNTTLMIPYSLFAVLIPCHIMLLPWTAIEAFACFTEAYWFKTSATWMLMVSIPFTTTENVFSWYFGGTLPILCICLFDTIIDFIVAIIG